MTDNISDNHGEELIQMSEANEEGKFDCGSSPSLSGLDLAELLRSHAAFVEARAPEHLDSDFRTVAADMRLSAAVLRDLAIAIGESVKLQSHYAKLLNMHDGGRRVGFVSADAWINRLRECGKLAR